MHVLTIDYNNGWQCKQAWKQLKASNNAMEARENKLEERRGGIRMEAMKKQFEYQLEEEELTHIRWFLTSLHRLKTSLLAR